MTDWQGGSEGSDYVPVQAAYRSTPWRVLVCCALLNLTSRTQVRRMIVGFFERWPLPGDVAAAERDLEEYIHSCGMSQQRASRLRRMAGDFKRADVLTRSSIQAMHGCGQYAADSFDIFCRGDLTVRPSDPVLAEYVERRNRVER